MKNLILKSTASLFLLSLIVFSSCTKQEELSQGNFSKNSQKSICSSLSTIGTARFDQTPINTSTIYKFSSGLFLKMNFKFDKIDNANIKFNMHNNNYNYIFETPITVTENQLASRTYRAKAYQKNSSSYTTVNVKIISGTISNSLVNGLCKKTLTIRFQISNYYTTYAPVEYVASEI